MQPIDDNDRKVLLHALTNEREQLEIEALIPQADRGLMTDEQYVQMIAHVTELHDSILENRYMIFDTRPRCVVIEDKEQCENEGRYQPFVFVYIGGSKQPIAQLAVEPPLRICADHASGKLGLYLDKNQWREIQAQVMKQAQQVALYDDARVMYLDHQTQQIVPPLKPDIAIVGAIN